MVCFSLVSVFSVDSLSSEHIKVLESASHVERQRLPNGEEVLTVCHVVHLIDSLTLAHSICCSHLGPRTLCNVSPSNCPAYDT